MHARNVPGVNFPFSIAHASASPARFCCQLVIATDVRIAAISLTAALAQSLSVVHAKGLAACHFSNALS